MKTLTTVTNARVLSLPFAGSATFEWDRAEPIAMTMTVSLGMPFLDDITWHFSRELLDRALSTPGRPAGAGDVIIEEIEPSAAYYRPEPSMRPGPLVRFLLASDNGAHAAIIVPQVPLMDFMVRSYMHVPAAREGVDVDQAIAQIFGAAS